MRPTSDTPGGGYGYAPPPRPPKRVGGSALWAVELAEDDLAEEDLGRTRRGTHASTASTGGYQVEVTTSHRFLNPAEDSGLGTSLSLAGYAFNDAALAASARDADAPAGFSGPRLAADGASLPDIQAEVASNSTTLFTMFQSRDGHGHVLQPAPPDGSGFHSFRPRTSPSILRSVSRGGAGCGTRGGGGGTSSSMGSESRRPGTTVGIPGGYQPTGGRFTRGGMGSRGAKPAALYPRAPGMTQKSFLADTRGHGASNANPAPDLRLLYQHPAGFMVGNASDSFSFVHSSLARRGRE